MARVWYVGLYPYREITPRDWDNVGLFGPHFQWSADNGWSVDQGLFSPAHLTYLEGDPEFLLGQEGVRPDTPTPEDGVTRPYRVDAAILKLVNDAFAALATTEAALGNINQSKAAAAQSATDAATQRQKAEEARDIALAAKVEWKGAWAISPAYNTRDVVSHIGSSWIALAPSTGVAPGQDATKWALLASKGEAGNAAYPAMTAAVAQAGTETVDRSITAVVLKGAIQKWVTGVATVAVSTIGRGLNSAADALTARNIIEAEQEGWIGTTVQYNQLVMKDPNRNYYLTD